jgi:Cys-rich repeat protein
VARFAPIACVPRDELTLSDAVGLQAFCIVNRATNDCGDDVPVSCVDYYCGGCNTFFYDATGSQICVPKSNETTPPGCASDSDCQEGEYCSDGTCLQQGQCSDVVDCFNPSNIYPSIACVGPVICDQGACGRVCSDSNCPNGIEPFACIDSPCNGVASEECLAKSPISCDVHQRFRLSRRRVLFGWYLSEARRMR